MRSVCLTLALTFSLNSFSQVPSQPGAANPHPILARASASMGCQLINPTTVISVTGHLLPSSAPAPMPLTIVSQGNSRWRSELDTPKERKVTIVNDGKGQIQHADGSTIPLSENNTSHQRPMHIPCLTNLALPAGAVEATYLRAESTAADSFDVIELLPAGHPGPKWAADRMKTTLWISRASGYVTKLQYINSAEQDPNDSQAVEIEYSDYRVVNGLAVPFHQVTQAGQLTLELQIDSVQINANAADFSLR